MRRSSSSSYTSRMLTSWPLSATKPAMLFSPIGRRMLCTPLRPVLTRVTMEAPPSSSA